MIIELLPSLLLSVTVSSIFPSSILYYYFHLFPCSWLINADSWNNWSFTISLIICHCKFDLCFISTVYLSAISVITVCFLHFFIQLQHFRAVSVFLCWSRIIIVSNHRLQSKKWSVLQFVCIFFVSCSMNKCYNLQLALHCSQVLLARNWTSSSVTLTPGPTMLMWSNEPACFICTLLLSVSRASHLFSHLLWWLMICMFHQVMIHFLWLLIMWTIFSVITYDWNYIVLWHRFGFCYTHLFDCIDWHVNLICLRLKATLWCRSITFF